MDSLLPQKIKIKQNFFIENRCNSSETLCKFTFVSLAPGVIFALSIDTTIVQVLQAMTLYSHCSHLDEISLEKSHSSKVLSILSRHSLQRRNLKKDQPGSFEDNVSQEPFLSTDAKLWLSSLKSGPVYFIYLRFAPPMLRHELLTQLNPRFGKRRAKFPEMPKNFL